MMSLANSVAEADLWNVVGGLSELPSQLLLLSDAKYMNAEVTAVLLKQDEAYDLTYKFQGSNMESDVFDIVVIAAPLMSNARTLRFRNFPDDLSRHEGTYQRAITTFVKGDLNEKTFKLEPRPDTVMPSKPTLNFDGISKVLPISSKKEPAYNVYRVHSRAPLSDNLVDELFQGVGATTSKEWLAHPRYKTTSYIPPFILHPGLYYINAIEWAASYMEMSIIAARNIALLARNSWNRKSDGRLRYEKDEL